MDFLIKATSDKEFVKAQLPNLAKEFDFWMRQRLTNVKDSQGKVHKMARYFSNVDGPRPGF